MEVTLEENDTISRTLTVTVPQEQYAQKLDARLRHLARTVRMDGFRPGHVPLQIVRQRYLQEAQESVVSKLVESSLQEALVEKQLQPVVNPKINVDSVGEDAPLRYRAEFDVFPTVTEEQIQSLSLTDWQVTISDSDVEAGVDHLRENLTEWNVVERPLVAGDQAIVKLEAGSEEVAVAEISESSQELALILKPGTLLEELHGDLLGMSATEEKLVRVTFQPRDEQTQTEQSSYFRVLVTKVREPHKPAMDDPRLLQYFACENAEGLLAQVRQHMGYRNDDMLRTRYRMDIVSRLFAPDSGRLELPTSLAAWCLEVRLREAGLEEVPEEGHPMHSEALSDAAQITAYQVLSALANVEPTDEDRTQIENAFVGQYRDENEARERIRSDSQTRDHLEREATWAALIRWVMQRAQVQTKNISMEQLKDINSGQPNEEVQ